MKAFPTEAITPSFSQPVAELLQTDSQALPALKGFTLIMRSDSVGFLKPLNNHFEALRVTKGDLVGTLRMRCFFGVCDEAFER